MHDHATRQSRFAYAPPAPLTATPNPITVLLAEDHALVRSGLRSLLHRSLPGVQIVAEAGDGREAVRLAAELAPDVVVMDVVMPELNGVDAARQIVNRRTGTRVVALSAQADGRCVRRMLDAGAAGYLPKTAAFEELAGAIRAVLAGKVYLSPAVADEALWTCDTPPGDGHETIPLTSREREVLQLLAEGKATKEVAHLLGISVKTAETHRRSLMEKLDLYSVAELTKYAIREGMTTAER